MTSIKSLATDHFGSLNTESIQQITANTVGYLFRTRYSNDLTSVIRNSVPEARVIDFRKDLQNSYYLRNIKLWIWRVLSCEFTPSRAWRMMDTYEIEDKDQDLIRLVMRDKKLRGELEGLTSDFKSHRLVQYDAILDSVLEELHTHISKFAWRKLRFITMGGYMSLEDIVVDLKMDGLYAMRLQYPQVHSRLHLVNVCKRAVHNFGMNMISQYTTKSRQHLRQEADGTFSAVKVSIDSSAGGFLHNVNQMSDLSGYNLNEHRPSLIDKMSIDKALSSLNGRQRSFGRLLLGDYNEAFSDWLQESGYSDNDEYLDYCMQKDRVNDYITLAAEFLGLTEYKANIIMNDIRSNL